MLVKFMGGMPICYLELGQVLPDGEYSVEDTLGKRLVDSGQFNEVVSEVVVDVPKDEPIKRSTKIEPESSKEEQPVV